jgi:DNA-binding transcriptional LysR family regulator
MLWKTCARIWVARAPLKNSASPIAAAIPSGRTLTKQIRQLESQMGVRLFTRSRAEILTAFSRRRPGWRVEMRAASWLDPTAGLASGDTDVALLRLPFPGQDSLRTEVLLTEPRWVALPASHPLAARDQICFRDLWDEPFVANGHGVALAPESAARNYARPGEPASCWRCPRAA